MRYFLLAILLFTGCAQDTPKTQAGNDSIPGLKPESKYEVVAEHKIGMILSGALLYVKDDLNGDGIEDIAVIGQAKQNLYRISLYLKSGKYWILTNYAPVDLVHLFIADPVRYYDYWEQHLFLPVPVPEDNEVLALDVDGIPGKEIIIPIHGGTYNAFHIYKLLPDNIQKMGEVLGGNGIFNYNGKIIFIGHFITDFAFYNLEFYTYFYAFIVNKRIVEIKGLPEPFYSIYLKYYVSAFEKKHLFWRFYDAFLFQYASGHETEAKRWFLMNMKKIQFHPGEEKELEEFKEHFNI